MLGHKTIIRLAPGQSQLLSLVVRCWWGESITAWREKPMPRYEIIIYWSQADEAFITEVPETPG